MNEKVIVTKTAITPTIKLNETQIIMQRHGNYDRKNGGLTTESKEEQIKISEDFLANLTLNRAEELENTYFLFIASPTISRGDFQRCMETTDITFSLTKDFYKNIGLPESHIINISEESNYNGIVKGSKDLVEPKLFTENIDYLNFLKQQTDGINLDFWINFESDRYKEKRQELGAEGPDEIVNRGIHFIRILERYSKLFHQSHPDSKLIIWCGTHYDLISPFIKQTILNYDKEDSVAVGYCCGISLKIDAENNMTANLNGQDFSINFPDRKQPLQHFRK